MCVLQTSEFADTQAKEARCVAEIVAYLLEVPSTVRHESVAFCYCYLVTGVVKSCFFVFCAVYIKAELFLNCAFLGSVIFYSSFLSACCMSNYMDVPKFCGYTNCPQAFGSCIFMHHTVM